MLSEFAISQRGESHIKHDIPCQDYSTSFTLTTGDDQTLVVGIVADGVGSEALSDEGSRIVVETVAEYIRNALAAGPKVGTDLALDYGFGAELDEPEPEPELKAEFATKPKSAKGEELVRGMAERIPDPAAEPVPEPYPYPEPEPRPEFEESSQSMTELMEDAFEEALDALLQAAEQRQSMFSQFASTLTAAIFDGSTLWFGHAGDDGIVVMRQDGTYGMITKRHEGELANSVVPFGVHHWDFGEEKNVASCVLMTDGVLDYCVSDELEDNRVKLPFLKPLLYAVLETEEDVAATRQDWDDFLAVPAQRVEEGDSGPKTAFRDFVRDDLSIALLSNSEAVAGLPAYSFDVEQWNRETERYNAQREDRLKELARERLERDSSYSKRVRLGQDESVQAAARAAAGTSRQSVVAEANGNAGAGLTSAPLGGNEGQVTQEASSVQGAHAIPGGQATQQAAPAQSAPAQTAPAQAGSAKPSSSHRPRGNQTTPGTKESSENLGDTVARGANTVFKGLEIIGNAIDDAVWGRRNKR